VFVVGHDWGAQVAWHLCLFRPDRVRAAAVLGIPYYARQAHPIMEVFAAFGDGFYINQFQVLTRSSSTMSSTLADFVLAILHPSINRNIFFVVAGLHRTETLALIE
jgi:pimeloyl-ACP methyl ester carboxylesterase